MPTIASAARTAYDLSFQISPIILTGGSASSILGNMVPIVALWGQVAALAQGILSSGSVSTDDFFARFVPIPGSNLISNTIGMYPFANQQVAANAIIQQPLNISLEMIAPVKEAGGYLTKLAIFTSLQNALQQHNLSGGTYTIATPAFIYTNCIMTGMADVTTNETKQQQIRYQLDFIQPLVSQQAANAVASAFNNKMSQLTGGQQITSPDWSGGGAAVGGPIQGAPGSLTGLAGAAQTYNTGPAQGADFSGVVGSVVQ